AVEEALDADHRVELQQRQRRRRVVQVDGPVEDALLHRLRQRAYVDLQSQRERLLRAETGADAAVRRALDRLVQVQGAAPERLVAERVEAEGLFALADQRGAGVVCLALAGRAAAAPAPVTPTGPPAALTARGVPLRPPPWGVRGTPPRAPRRPRVSVLEGDEGAMPLPASFSRLKLLSIEACSAEREDVNARRR